MEKCSLELNLDHYDNDDNNDVDVLMLLDPTTSDCVVFWPRFQIATANAPTNTFWPKEWLKQSNSNSKPATSTDQ